MTPCLALHTREFDMLDRLALTLTSEKTDGERIYRLIAGKPSKSRPNSNISAPPTA
jgi:hypothetical protein